MTLSSFRSLPRKGHLDRAKRVVSYIYRFKYAKVRFCTHEPDFSNLVIPEYDWSSTAYGTVREAVPHDAPTPLGKPVVTVLYVDANLLHCLNTGRSVTGILHFLNGTPIDWYSKKMATVETATYGAEFLSARTCVEQLFDLGCRCRNIEISQTSEFLQTCATHASLVCCCRHIKLKPTISEFPTCINRS